MVKIYKQPIVPINKTAGLVISKGENWEFNYNKNSSLEWDDRPETIPLPKNVLDITGLKCDRITIVGLYKCIAKDKSAGYPWVGRCVCGRYVVRLHRRFLKAIRRKTENKCTRCSRIESMRKGFKKV